LRRFAHNNDLKIDFIAAGLDDLVLDEDIQINIYRLIQEALHNVRNMPRPKASPSAWWPPRPT
jgi:signal transduction histidine kinase